MKTSTLQKAIKIRELEVAMQNIATDDKRALDSYTDEEILNEARYVLSTFYEGGHQNNDELICEYGDIAAQREAKKQVAALKILINPAKKHRRAKQK